MQVTLVTTSGNESAIIVVVLFLCVSFREVQALAMKINCQKSQNLFWEKISFQLHQWDQIVHSTYREKKCYFETLPQGISHSSKTDSDIAKH